MGLKINRKPQFEKQIPMPNNAGPGGAPRLYSSPDEFVEVANQYFDWADSNHRPYTVENLCYYLGFAHRFALYDYERRSPEFAHAVTRIRLRIAGNRMDGGLSGTQDNKIVIFDLINNHAGYRDTRDIQVSGQVTHVLGTEDDDELEMILGPAPVPLLENKTED